MYRLDVVLKESRWMLASQLLARDGRIISESLAEVLTSQMKGNAPGNSPQKSDGSCH